MARPFLKWAGGKRQMIPAIEERLPSDIGQYDTYIEPFVGGGALMFHLLGRYDFENTHISDLNPELILCYRELQRDSSAVFEELSKLIESYPKEQNEREPVFYSIRSEWNSDVGRIGKLSQSDKVTRAAQTLFLNKTCFNGLFRVNRNGQFNVPIGRYVKPSFQSREELSDVQEALSGVSIHLSSFEECEKWVKGDTFVYFDPPYRPLSPTSSFVSYFKDEFDDSDQEMLAGVFRSLDKGGVRVMLSNSDPKNTSPDDDFFDDLYSGFRIDRVDSNRSINSLASARGPISELIIHNGQVQ